MFGDDGVAVLPFPDLSVQAAKPTPLHVDVSAVSSQRAQLARAVGTNSGVKGGALEYRCVLGSEPLSPHFHAK
jgi:hypothetical protein